MSRIEQEEWLLLGEAAKQLNIHPTTLRRWADDGEIPVMLTPGGHRRFALSDLKQFAEQRHGLRPAGGVEQVWADQALTAARSEIVAHRNDQSLVGLDEETRAQNRKMGRELMALILQFVSNGGDEDLLQEARNIGKQYGRHCQKMQLSLTEPLQASIFFRETMIETAIHLPENVHNIPETNLQLMRRMNTV
jgi:excisionase family DNA binding protein